MNSFAFIAVPYLLFEPSPLALSNRLLGWNKPESVTGPVTRGHVEVRPLGRQYGPTFVAWSLRKAPTTIRSFQRHLLPALRPRPELGGTCGSGGGEDHTICSIRRKPRQHAL